MDDRVLTFKRTPAVRRHYLYGANCYQHAIGFDKAILWVRMPDNHQDCRLVDYMTLAPGSYGHVPAPSDPAEFRDFFLEYCKEDGLIDLNGHFEQRAGYRTLAFFVGVMPQGRVDYHFAFLNADGLWEDKIPFREPRTHSSTAAIEKDTGYRFQRYLLCPPGVVPANLKRLDLKEVSVRSGAHTADILCVSYSPALLNSPLYQTVFFTDKNFGYFPIIKAVLPAPAFEQDMIDPRAWLSPDFGIA